MLVSQTAINFATNAFSAVFGLASVMIFTRLFAPAEFGIYVLGVGVAAVASIFMSTWLRLNILREQARGDGTDVRGIALPGFLLSCLMAPAFYAVARIAGLGVEPAVAAVGLALTLGFYETSQELLRVRLRSFTVMKMTMIRAVLLPTLGVAFTAAGTSGVLLLTASALAYLLAAVALTRDTWWGTTIRFDSARLWLIAKAGFPLTLSLTLLAVSSVMDRFIIAHVIGEAYAGQYSAGVDLVRQTLIIPAVSASAAFMPLAVQILANRGADAVRAHLEECFELLLAIALPACLGFAVISPHVANVLLGAEFRELAGQVMPVVAVAVVFQIVTNQYLHVSFLLSHRNSFYLINTATMVVFNAIVAYVLIVYFGAVGAAWGRLAAEAFGLAVALMLSRRAFPVPLPLRCIASVLAVAVSMAIVVEGVDLLLPADDASALAILIGTGIVVYSALCWAFNIAQTRRRVNRAMLLLGVIVAQRGFKGLRP